MDLARLAVLGAVIGSNNLAASLALGALGQARYRWRVVLVFGLFEFFVPLIGMALGQRATGWAGAQLGWLPPVLLAALGAWTLVSGLREQPANEAFAGRVASWGGLSALALGLSLDNLAVGFGLGIRGLEPLEVAVAIAAFSMAFSYAGIRLGRQARRHWERLAKAGAGALLLALAGALWAGWL